MTLSESFHTLFNAYNKYINENIKSTSDNDLSMNSYQYLIAIYDAKAITTTKLSQQLGLKKASITQMLQNLEEKGYVQRKPNVEDKRSSMLTLTQRGFDLVQNEEQLYLQFEAKLHHILSQTELDQLEGLMSKLAGGIAHEFK